ncbi:MAG: hypothetical protein MI755_16530 [Sphingomonadales bacterium]|nr:hypothetical protein [Sphingomonadales bacterium]
MIYNPTDHDQAGFWYWGIFRGEDGEWRAREECLENANDHIVVHAGTERQARARAEALVDWLNVAEGNRVVAAGCYDQEITAERAVQIAFAGPALNKPSQETA